MRPREGWEEVSGLDIQPQICAIGDGGDDEDMAASSSKVGRFPDRGRGAREGGDHLEEEGSSLKDAS